MAEFGHKVLLPRFWAKVEIRDCGYRTKCWVWTAYRDAGSYGHYTFAGRGWLAHRVAYEAFKSWIPEDLEIDHLCRNHSCVNPDHLEAVPGEENRRRGLVPDFGLHNRTKTHCPQGHFYDEENTYLDKKNNKRHCRTCNREWLRQYRRRKRLDKE